MTIDISVIKFVHFFLFLFFVRIDNALSNCANVLSKNDFNLHFKATVSILKVSRDNWMISKMKKKLFQCKMHYNIKTHTLIFYNDIQYNSLAIDMHIKRALNLQTVIFSLQKIRDCLWHRLITPFNS